MRFIRLHDMTDEEYALVSMSSCPKCGSCGHATVSYGDIKSDSRSVDVMCQGCGFSWSVYALSEASNQDEPPTPKSVVIDELSHLSVNKIRHLKKGVLMAMAMDYGNRNALKMSKHELEEFLIGIKGGSNGQEGE